MKGLKGLQKHKSGLRNRVYLLFFVVVFVAVVCLFVVCFLQLQTPICDCHLPAAERCVQALS